MGGGGREWAGVGGEALIEFPQRGGDDEVAEMGGAASL